MPPSTTATTSPHNGNSTIRSSPRSVARARAHFRRQRGMASSLASSAATSTPSIPEQQQQVEEVSNNNTTTPPTGTPSSSSKRQQQQQPLLPPAATTSTFQPVRVVTVGSTSTTTTCTSSRRAATPEPVVTRETTKTKEESTAPVLQEQEVVPSKTPTTTSCRSNINNKHEKTQSSSTTTTSGSSTNHHHSRREPPAAPQQDDVLQLNTSSSSDATPDPETLWNVQAFIDTIHKHHHQRTRQQQEQCNEEDDDWTAPESPVSSQSSNRQNPHHPPPQDEEAGEKDEDPGILVDAAVVANIGKYIDMLHDAADAESWNSHKGEGESTSTAVPPKMLHLVRQWIDHLPPTPSSPPQQQNHDALQQQVHVDPETMAAVEACMEWVLSQNNQQKKKEQPYSHSLSKEQQTSGGGRHDITVGAATVNMDMPHSLSESQAPTVASEEDEEDDDEQDNEDDLQTGTIQSSVAPHHVGSCTTEGATRGHLCLDTNHNDNNTSSTDSSTKRRIMVPDDVEWMASCSSDAAVIASFSGPQDDASQSTPAPISPVQSAVNFWEQKSMRSAQPHAPSVRSGKSTTVGGDMKEPEDPPAAMAEEQARPSVTDGPVDAPPPATAEHVWPDVLSLHSAEILSQNSPATSPYNNNNALPMVPSYRSYGQSSSSSSSAGDAPSPSEEEAVPNTIPDSEQSESRPPDRVASEAVTDSIAESGIAEEAQVPPKLVIKRAETPMTQESELLSGKSARRNSQLIVHDSKPPPAVDSSVNQPPSAKSESSHFSDSVDARVNDLIDAVEGWGGEGSFVDYSIAINGGSLDSGALEALKELVADAESSHGATADQTSVDEQVVPQELGEELNTFLDAYRARKSGETIEMPSQLIRVKKDPPTDLPSEETKEDPPIVATSSHELTRWTSGNENPETNPQKTEVPADHQTHLDPECEQSLMRALSDELLAKKNANRKNIPPRPPSLTPDPPTQSFHSEEEPTPYSHRDADYNASSARKSGPPRPEASRSKNRDGEEKKEECIVLDSGESCTDESAMGIDKSKVFAAKSERASRPISPPPKPETPTSFAGRRPRSPRTKSDPAKDDSLLKSAAFQNIASRLIDDDTDTEAKLALAQLVRLSFADVQQGKIPHSESETHKGLSSEVVKCFVDAVARSQKQSGLEETSAELRAMNAGKSRRNGNPADDTEMLAFVEQIATAVEMVDKNIPLDFVLPSVDSEADAIEYDINSGYVQQDHAAYDVDKEEIPWWEASAQLAVKSMDLLDGGNDESDGSENSDPSSEDETDEKTDSYSGSTSKKTGSTEPKIPKTIVEMVSVEDDIDDFWKSQHELRERRMKVREKAEKKKQASALPYINNTSYSYNSQTSGQSGSYSKATIQSKASAESLDTLDERWLLKRSMAGHGQWSKPQQWLSSNKETVLEVDEPEPINGTSASNAILDISCRWREQRNAVFSSKWALSYELRSSPHSGYQGVDIYSLADSAHVPAKPPSHRLDKLPWELREVKQYFLHEQSAVNRNWFGKLKRYSSVTIDMPVCKPRSMEMPVKAPEWTEDWYRTPALHSLGTNLSGSAGVSGDDGEAEEYYRKYVLSEDDFSEESDWEDTPECGTLKNVKLKPGERISRVTPDLTSSLRRSRWRKKFFPKGTFPY